MFYLDIQGKASRRRCRDVVDGSSKVHHLYITVSHRGLKREAVIGFCSVTDCDHRPRKFLIEMETTLSAGPFVTVK